MTVRSSSGGVGLGLKMGIIIGLISIGIHYAAALCLHKQMVVAWGLLIGGLMIITTILYGVTGVQFVHRARQSVNFQGIFKTILVAILISTVLSFAWSIVYMKFIGTDYATDYQQSRLAVLKMMHKTAAEIAAEAAAMKEKGQYAVSIGGQVIFLGELILAKSVVGGIITMLLMKTPKSAAI